MKFTEFKKLMESYDDFHKSLSKLSELGVNFYESDLPILSSFEDVVFNVALKSHYTKEGVDWVEWYIYESDNGRNKATWHDRRIAYDLKSLHYLLESEYKLNNKEAYGRRLPKLIKTISQ